MYSYGEAGPMAGLRPKVIAQLDVVLKTNRIG